MDMKIIATEIGAEIHVSNNVHSFAMNVLFACILQYPCSF